MIFIFTEARLARNAASVVQNGVYAPEQDENQ